MHQFCTGFVRCAAVAALIGFGGLTASVEATPPGPRSGSEIQSKDATLWQIHEYINASMGLSRSELVTVEYDHVYGVPLATTVEIDGQAWTIDLAPHSVRGSGYRVYRSDGPDHLEEVEAGPVNTLRGVVLEDEGSTVAGGMLEDGMHAVITFSNGERWWVEPVSNFVAGLPFETHVVYHELDVLPIEGSCPVNDKLLADEMGQPTQVESDGAADGIDDLSLAELAIDADFQYYQEWGSSIQNVENRVNLVINTINSQYESEVQIRHGVVAIIVRTSQVYTTNSAGGLLDQFRSRWLNNHGDIVRDVAHLFTGRNLSGSTIGIAFTIGGICTSSAYCLAQNNVGNFSCETDLSAHELGHLWGAFHCDPCTTTMRSSLNCANTFIQGSINSIVAHRNSRSCLSGVFCDASSLVPSNEHITNVQYAGVNNSSGTSAYSDFTIISGSVQLGEAVPFSLTIGNANSNDLGGVWIDWNLDGDFHDADETIDISMSGPGPYSTVINVPGHATIGDTRLRTRIQRSTQNPVVDPCGTTSRGEVEDYGIRVLQADAPTNDDCANPIVVSLGSTPFSTFGATTDGPFEPALCDSGEDEDIAADIWFEFTAPCGGNFTASLCGSDYDTKIGVYTSPCPVGSLEVIACNDDFCGVQSEVTFGGFADTTFLIRIGGHTSAASPQGAVGTGTVVITAACLDAGGCCLTGGTCELTNPGDCSTMGGTFQGIGTSCSPNPCTPPDPTGACCATDGTCSVATAGDCAGTGGIYQGDDMPCSPNPCTPPDPTGACCATDGTCSVATAGDCATTGGTYQGDDMPCDAGTCTPPCPADLDASGDVGFGDILSIISAWGPCGVPCPEDLSGNGNVDFADILAVIAAFGPCP
ncbi:MAG: hypothetical protein GY715_08150 [Planctomycetes bacterium]|nr:hypothetical protein [Planctomycetota bacterium]